MAARRSASTGSITPSVKKPARKVTASAAKKTPAKSAAKPTGAGARTASTARAKKDGLKAAHILNEIRNNGTVLKADIQRLLERLS